MTKIVSKETRAKLSAAMKARWAEMSPEERSALAAKRKRKRRNRGGVERAVTRRMSPEDNTRERLRSFLDAVGVTDCKVNSTNVSLPHEAVFRLIALGEAGITITASDLINLMARSRP